VSLEPTEQEVAELMARHGIARVQAVQYRYKSWRYSNLSEGAKAVAQRVPTDRLTKKLPIRCRPNDEARRYHSSPAQIGGLCHGHSIAFSS
jgi:hypothetical protein